jgi:hypothetical protein
MERQADIVKHIRLLLRPIYAGSGIPIGAAAELLLGLVENHGSNEGAMATIVSIFSTLLPAGNEIPSYKVLKSMVARTGGLQWEIYPICAECEMFVFDIDDKREACPRPQCMADRDVNNEKKLIYFPLEPQLRRLLENESLRVYFTRAALQRESTDSRMRCIKDSPFWKKWVLDSGFADSDGVFLLVLGTCGDGAPPWKSSAKRFKYSIYFMSSEILNFPFTIMSNWRNRLFHFMWPGTSSVYYTYYAIVTVLDLEGVNEL